MKTLTVEVVVSVCEIVVALNVRVETLVLFALEISFVKVTLKVRVSPLIKVAVLRVLDLSTTVSVKVCLPVVLFVSITERMDVRVVVVSFPIVFVSVDVVKLVSWNV